MFSMSLCREQSSRFHHLQEVQFLKQQSGVRPPTYHQPVRVTTWCSLFSEGFKSRSNGNNTFHSSSTCVSLVHILFSSKFWAQSWYYWVFCLLWLFLAKMSHFWFSLATKFSPLNSLIDVILCLSFKSWTVTLSEAKEVYSALDLVQGSCVTYWISQRHASGVILGGVTHGKIPHCTMFCLSLLTASRLFNWLVNCTDFAVNWSAFLRIW